MNMKEEGLYQQEYETRVMYMKIDFKGKMHIPCEANFHPHLFVGTMKEYDYIFDKFLRGREDEFKVIGIHSFDTYCEYYKKFGKLISG